MRSSRRICDLSSSRLCEHLHNRLVIVFKQYLLSNIKVRSLKPADGPKLMSSKMRLQYIVVLPMVISAAQATVYAIFSKGTSYTPFGTSPELICRATLRRFETGQRAHR